jgi:hypothetical protein
MTSEAISGDQALTAATSASPTTSGVPSLPVSVCNRAAVLTVSPITANDMQVFAADVAENGRPVVDADAHREPPLCSALVILIPTLERIDHLSGAGERVS